jgi:diaminopropionate ammonia-lyase
MQTLMAGLACGEANPAAWQILKNYAQVFVSCPDYLAANGMRILSSPLQGDPRIISGESGAVTTGLLYEIMTKEVYQDLRATLKLDPSSTILLFSTEGDTDPDMYQQIVWLGRNEKSPSFPLRGQAKTFSSF